MWYAYHIKDDRYDHVQTELRSFPDDEFDRHEWLRNVHDSLRHIPSDVAFELAGQMVPTAGDDTLPPLQRMLSTATDPRQNRRHRRTSTMSSTAAPNGFADIGVDDTGNLIVSWLEPSCRDKFVNLSAVMNQGVFCVPEHLPVSNARLLFTNLGLRHVVVHRL